MAIRLSFDSNARFLLGNSIWLMVGRGGVQLLGMLLTILVARSLGDVGLGQLTVVMTVVFIGNVLSTFGLDTHLIRILAKGPNPAESFTALVVQLTFSSIFIAAVWLFAPATVIGDGSKIFALSLIPLAFTTVFSAHLRAIEQMQTYTWLQLFAATCRLLTIAALILFNQPFLTLVWGLLGCSVIEAIVAGLATPGSLKTFTQSGRPNLAHLKRIVIAGFGLAALTLMAVLYQRVGILLLAQWADPEAAGQFTAALRLVEAPRILPYAFAAALFPQMVKPGSAQQISGRWFGWMTVGTATFSLLIQPLAPWIIDFLYGAGFEEATSTLRILVWSLIPFVGVTYGSLVLVARNQEKQTAVGHAIALSLAALLGLLFFNRWGLPGLAVGLVVAESIHAVILLWLVFREEPHAS